MLKLNLFIHIEKIGITLGEFPVICRSCACYLPESLIGVIHSAKNGKCEDIQITQVLLQTQEEIISEGQIIAF